MAEREEGCRLIAANYTFLFPSRRRNVKGKESDERWRPGEGRAGQARGEASNFLPPSRSLSPSTRFYFRRFALPTAANRFSPPLYPPSLSLSLSLSFLRHTFF